MTRLALAALALALAVPCEALVLCRQKKGHVVVRDACRKKEQAVDLTALGPLGPTGTAGTPGAPGALGVHPLRMLDDAGVEVGSIVQFFPTGAFVEITHPLLGQPVVFLLAPSGFARNTAGAISTVYYQSSDCTGVPFVRQQSDRVLAQVYGTHVYFSSADEADRTYASAESDPGDGSCGGGSVATGRNTCCATTSGTARSQPAVRVPLADLGLTPPFRTVPR